MVLRVIQFVLSAPHLLGFSNMACMELTVCLQASELGGLQWMKTMTMKTISVIIRVRCR